MTTLIAQYKILFFLSWVILYLVFPMWALPISVSSRALVFIGLTIYFFISALIMNRWFEGLRPNKTAIVKTSDRVKYIKDNIPLVIICCIAVIVHIHPLFLPILISGDESLHLGSGLLIYDYIDNSWHRVIQIVFWVIIGLLIFIWNNHRMKEFIFNKFAYLSDEIKSSSSIFVCVLSFLILLVSYFLLLRNITYFPNITRYPPLIKLFYFSLYSAFGITHVGPRMLQLIFYVLGAVYLYRTITLFSNKESALIGATIYLFFPVMFTYARLAEPGCGTVFFIILTSFHFLRFIKQDDERDLVLTTFFIGFGFMYKRAVLLMFFICFLYLIGRIIKSRELYLINYLKVLLISLVPIIPFMIIGRFFNWRNYSISWSNFRPFDGKGFTFFLDFPRDISWVLFLLFLTAIVYMMLYKRNTLLLYSGFLFLSYYLFLVADIGNYSPRLYMALYPAVAVCVSQFVYSLIDRIRWKHSFKAMYFALCIYLISICTVPSLNAQYISDAEFNKLAFFPSDAAMQWVKNNVKDGEKILILRILSAPFYKNKYSIDRNKIDDSWFKNRVVSTPEKLLKYYKDNEMTYVMFPSLSMDIEVVEYLKENRNGEFIEVARFNRDENDIYIYRLKGS